MVMRIMVLVALLGHSSVANSQYGVTYPVDINAMLTPPYGTCLTDYVGTNRFQCNVLMRDMHATGYKFRILMTVKDMASGRVMFSAQSDQHTVTPGKPVYMAETGVFSEFFKAGNILSSTAYRDGCLNEGAYNFVFQVVDDNDKRRIPISKECVFPARLQAGGAPLLISPFTGTNIDCNQTIVNFSWQMPIVTGEQTKYLIEICPTDDGGNGLHYLGSYTPSANGSGPSQGYIHATSYMPMYQLIETEGMKLVPNTTYFWRVSIIDELGNVKPNSTSEIDSFTYCYTKELEPYVPLKEPLVKAINSELDTVHIDTVKTEDNATKATWFLDDVRFKYQSYALDIRKKSQDTWTTYHIKINEGDTEEKNYYGLSNLKYNEPYEARMQYLLITDNDTSYAPFSDTITFVVPNPMDTADCGEIMAIKDCNGEKGKILKKYDTLYANGTPVVLDSIIYKAGDSTVISGFGVISFPILRNFKLKMSFNEVSVNCYGELVSGQVVSVYNESTGAIIDLNHWTGKGDGGGSQSTNERPDPTNYKDKDEAKEKMQTGDYAQIGDSIYTKDKDGNVVALGKTLSIPAEKYTNNNTLDDDDVYCIFRNDTNDAPFIGFDADEHKYYRGRPTLGDHYTPTFSKQDGADFEYIIPYVASNPGRVVKLSATLEGRLTDEYNKDSVKFIMPLSGGNYLALNAKKDGDKFIVDFPGGKNPDTNSDVYAIVKKGEKYVNVGKINIETYAWRTQKVKFVPVVNDYGVDEKAISETLNRIYGRFGITYEVTKDEKFENEYINSEFLDNFSVSSGTFTKQSDDMKRLQYYYKTERGIQDSTAYIFLLKSAVDYPAIDGDMPQGQICGYIFMHSDNGTLSDGRLVAHELAHGIYRLDHVFEKAYGIPENSTDNLLDYNNGDQLAHFQWELIKKPGFAWALLESDEENMAAQLLLCVAKAFADWGIDKAIGVVVTELVETLLDENSGDDGNFDISKLGTSVSVGTTDVVSLITNYAECVFPAAGMKNYYKILKTLAGGSSTFSDCYWGTTLQLTDDGAEDKSVAQCICETVTSLIVDFLVGKIKDKFEATLNTKKNEGLKNFGEKAENIKKEFIEKIGHWTIDMLENKLSGLKLEEDKFLKMLDAAFATSSASGSIANSLAGSLVGKTCSSLLDDKLPPYENESMNVNMVDIDGERILNIDLYTSLPVKLEVKAGIVELNDKVNNSYKEEYIINYVDNGITKLNVPVENGNVLHSEEKQYFGSPKTLVEGDNAVTEYPLIIPKEIKISDKEYELVPYGKSIITRLDKSWWETIKNADKGVQKAGVDEWRSYPFVTETRAYHFKVKLPPCNLKEKNTMLEVTVRGFVKTGWKESVLTPCITGTYTPNLDVQQPEQPTQPVEPKTYYDECHDDDVKDGFTDKVFSVKSTKNATKEATEQRHHLEYEYDVPMCSGWTNGENERIYFSPKVGCGDSYKRIERLFYKEKSEERATFNIDVQRNYLNLNNNKLVLTYWTNPDKYDFSTVDKLFVYKIENGKGVVYPQDDIAQYYTDDSLANMALRLYIKINSVLFWNFANLHKNAIKVKTLDDIDGLMKKILTDNMGNANFSTMVRNDIMANPVSIPLAGANGSYNLLNIKKNIGSENWDNLISVIKNNMTETEKIKLRESIRSVINGCTENAAVIMKSIMRKVAKSLCGAKYANPIISAVSPQLNQNGKLNIDFKAQNYSAEYLDNWNSVILSHIDMLMRMKMSSGGVLSGNVHICQPGFFRDCCDENCVNNDSFFSLESNTLVLDKETNKSVLKTEYYLKMIPELWLDNLK